MATMKKEGGGGFSTLNPDGTRKVEMPNFNGSMDFALTQPIPKMPWEDAENEQQHWELVNKTRRDAGMQDLTPEELARARTFMLPSQQEFLNRSVRGQAKRFRENLPGYKDDQYNQVEKAGAIQMRENDDTIAKSSNQRGLLFSGLRQGAQASSRASIASTLAKQRAEINQEAEDLARSYESASANIGLASFGDALKRSESALNDSLQRAIERRRAISEIGSGIGYGLGTLYGRNSTDDKGK